MSRKPEHTLEIWTFAGYRQQAGSVKLLEAWITPSGDEAFFNADRRRWALGGRYEVMVVESGRLGDPKFTGESEHPKSDWVAKHEAALTHDQRRRAENRAKKQEHLERMRLMDLRVHLSRMNRGQRVALLARILSCLGVP